MSDEIKLWSYQQKVEWLMEQVKNGTVDIEDLTTQVETNTGDIATNKDDISDLDDRVEALENAPAPTGGLELISVEIGLEPDPNTGMYSLTISDEDKAKVLANPQNCVIAFTENHIGTAYAYFTGIMSEVYTYIFNFISSATNINGTFPVITQTMIGISENMEGAMITTYTSTLDNKLTYEAGEGDIANTLDLTSDQLVEIYENAENVDYIRVTTGSYTIDLHYDGKANDTVYFSVRKPVSGGSGTATFSITKVMSVYTQYYNY